jgi:Glycosyl transferase family 90
MATELRIPLFGNIWRRWQLERDLNEYFRSNHVAVSVRVVNAKTDGSLHHIRLDKTQDRIVIGFSYRQVLRDPFLYGIFRTRLRPVVRLFSRTDSAIKHAIADISDGEEAGPGMIGMCAKVDGAILLPDYEFYEDHGYETFRAVAKASAVRWADRDDAIVWRGSTTGQGQISSKDMGREGVDLLQRTRMCLLLRDHPGVDAKFAKMAHSTDPRRDEVTLRSAGIFGELIPSLSWQHRKFALDIDGNSNTWANLFTRLLLGCCVIKIGSRFGYRQWYYGDLHPWEHYVPVAPDMTDLIEKIEWCRGHDGECAEIALRGQNFASRRTFETEMQSAVERIELALRPLV